MELVNFLVVIVCCLITSIWALKKRFEINTMKVSFIDENKDPQDIEEEELIRHERVLKDSDNLEYVSEMFQDVTMGILQKIEKYFFYTILLACFLIYYFFEESKYDTAQPIYFFIGSYSQIVIVGRIFKNYRMYDPRIIFLSR